MTGRILAIDLGLRRVGLAISDPTRTLARPLDTIAVSGEADALDLVARRIVELAADDDGLGLIVVGMPAALDGSATPASARTAAFVAALATRTPLPIAIEDERLTSREAESRLAERDRNWRTRKQRLDAAAAAIILQDFLDRQPRPDGHDRSDPHEAVDGRDTEGN